jgi:hypothetical protein
MKTRLPLFVGEIKKANQRSVEGFVADLSSLEEVRNLAHKVLNRHDNSMFLLTMQAQDQQTSDIAKMELIAFLRLIILLRFYSPNLFDTCFKKMQHHHEL